MKQSDITDKKRYSLYAYLLSDIDQIVSYYLNILCIQEKEVIIANIKRNLSIELDSILINTIVEYIKSQKGRDVNIYQKLFSNNCELIIQILSEFNPTAFIFLYNNLYQSKHNIHIFFKRLINDMESLKEKFDLSTSDYINKIDIQKGDKHNFGSSTCYIEFVSGIGIFYKPFNHHLDSLLTSLMTQYSLSKKENKIILLKYDSYEDYCYIKKLSTNKFTNNSKDIESLYYNYGELLAFGEFFCISDGHYENILVDIPHLYWIDLETGFNILDNFQLKDTLLINKFNQHNARRGVSTAIQKWSSPIITTSTPIIYNDETDDLYIKYVNIFEPNNKNHIFLNNQIVQPIDYLDCIINGYTKTLKYLYKNKDPILDQINDFAQSNKIVSRKIILSTQYYLTFMTLLRNSNAEYTNMLNTVRGKRVRMLEKTIHKQHHFFILHNEIQDIINGVVPYFYRDWESKNLYHASGTYTKNYFDSTLKDSLNNRIKTFSLINIHDNVDFIRQSLIIFGESVSSQVYKNKFHIDYV